MKELFLRKDEEGQIVKDDDGNPIYDEVEQNKFALAEDC